MTNRDVRKVLKLLRQIADIMGCSGKTLHAVGREAERRFEALAQQRGLTTENVSSRSLAYDLVVNGLLVQVKHRQPLASGAVSLCEKRRKGASIKAYLIGEFDVLALRCSGKWYLIPENVLRSGNGETLINNVYPEQYAEYVNNWGVFVDAGVTRHPDQLRLGFASL